MKSLLEIFPRASQSMIKANPHLDSQNIVKNDSKGIVGAAKAKRRGNMNATEREYSLILESMRQRGEVLRWCYEGITLRWDGLRYTPDFVVFDESSGLIQDGYFPRIKMVEIKGAFTGGKFERAIEHFRHARTYWPEFSFEMMQKTKNGWRRIH